MRSLPTGTVTFLFADVEGSTALQEDPRVDYAESITLLRRLLRDAVATHGARRPTPLVTNTSPRSRTVVRPRMQRSPPNVR